MSSEDNFVINITDTAAEEMKKALENEPENSAIRLRVIPGGCSGFSYRMEIELITEKTSELIEKNGIKLLVDSFSRQYLEGLSIDYIKTMASSGFKFENPNSSNTCGCGSSFSA